MKKISLILGGLLMGITLMAQAQRKITGTVTSRDGNPVVASITIKGTTHGITSNPSGQFSLDNVPAASVLVVSAVGYVKKEIPVGNSTEVNVLLEPSNEALDEVMVVAYGTAKKSTFTGSASVVNQNDFKDNSITSFETALNGRVPGLQVTTASGQPGSAPSIRIRGVGSMNASNEPLYVIDGVPVVSGNAGQMSDYTFTSNNVMSTLNPDDIESITVLKDAAAASLYGSRAANGVVIVTTKKGKIGKPVINLKTSVGITPSWATDNYEAAGVQDQVNMLYQVFYDYRTANGYTDEQANTYALGQLNSKFNKHGYSFQTSGTGLYDNVQIKGMTDGIENREGKYYDWDKAIFRTGVYQDHDLSVSGGTDNTNYYSSLSYTKDAGRVKTSDYDRISGRINLSQKIGKHIDFTSIVNISNNDQNGFNDTRNTSSNYFLQSRNLLWPLYWPTDYKTGEPWTDRYGSYAYNPEYYDNEWEASTNTTRIGTNETLNISILPELSVKSIFSFDNNEVKDHVYYSANHYNASSDNGVVDEMSTRIRKLVSSTTINYNKQFGLHGLSLLAGFEAEKNDTYFQRATGKNLPSSTLHTVATAGVFDANAYSWGNNLLSVLSKAEYNYDEKYYATASFRRDGSSRLAPDKRWGDFWSVGGSWRINKEAFMQDATFISNLRLRGSYGVNGTLPISDFGWRSLTSYSSKYMGSPGGLISTLGNEDLTWETNYAMNIGLEFGLFNDRLFGTVEYYNRDSKHLLQEVPISTVTGFGTILSNIGEINNHGVEIDLGYDVIRGNNWKWNVEVNGSFSKSTVTELYGGQDIIWDDPTGGDARAQFIYREGESTRSFYGYEWAGVDPANGKNVYYVNDPNNPSGDFEFKGRGATYNYADAKYVVLGSAIPTVYGGLNTTVSYKSISLGFNFNYKIGGKLYDGAYKDVADDGYYWERIRSAYFYDHMWTDSNPNGTLPKLAGTDLTDPMQYSSRQMHDATFIRLKNINLAYTLPVSLISKIGVSSARIYFNGTNLLTFSKYKIADPEVNDYGTRGWELPIGRIYTFGAQFSF